MDQLIADHQKARADFTQVVESVDPDRWDAPSPCPEWDTRGVVEHVIGFHDQLLLKPLGVKVERPREDPVVRWKATDAALSQALQDGVLDQEVEGPMGATTPRSLLPALTGDVLMHSWDVARAVGLDIELDPELSAAAFEMGQKNSDRLQASGMFGPPVAVDDDAPVADRMLGVFGRDPGVAPARLTVNPSRFGGGYAARSVKSVTTVTGEMLSRGHEQVVFVTDVASGLRAIIAVHSTALGPALGGVRFWHYEQAREDALVDVLRLSEAMTLKAAIAGLHQGGGKVVVLLDTVDAPHPEPMLLALGRAIDELGGRYLAAEDVGATQRDMDVIARETPWVTGVAPSAGGSGDPSPVTALGVLAAIRSVARALDGAPEVAGYRVAVQGAGHVGAHLAADLAAAGAHVVIADVNDARAHEVASAHGVEVVAPDEILDIECDVLAPCALGGVLNEETVPLLQCRAVCGAANNQLADDHVDELLHARGVLYGPDFVANAGGIINIAEEFTGYSRDRALVRAEAIEDTMTRVLERARAEGRGPGRVAEDMARERIANEGSSTRWHPGDPAAWTNGQPLTHLRPTHPKPGSKA